MSSKFVLPICVTCNLHKCSPFCLCIADIDPQYEKCTCPPQTFSSPSDDLHAIHASIARIEEKVDGLLRLERTHRREKSTQPEGEVNQKTQLREKRLEKDNLLLRTMLADALKLLSDE